MTNKGRNFTILLIEDNPGHARLIEKNLRRSKFVNNIINLRDGQEALNFLFSEAEYSNIKLPGSILVLLDLRLPVVDGYHVLERMKSDERISNIPVVVLTTTEDKHEIAKCYKLGCNLYITKPVDYEDFIEAINRMGLFLSIIQIPNGE